MKTLASLQTKNPPMTVNEVKEQLALWNLVRPDGTGSERIACLTRSKSTLHRMDRRNLHDRNPARSVRPPLRSRKRGSAAAVGLAAAFQERERIAGKTVATLLCGSNITDEQRRQWCGVVSGLRPIRPRRSARPRHFGAVRKQQPAMSGGAGGPLALWFRAMHAGDQQVGVAVDGRPSQQLQPERGGTGGLAYPAEQGGRRPGEVTIGGVGDRLEGSLLQSSCRPEKISLNRSGWAREGDIAVHHARIFASGSRAALRMGGNRMPEALKADRRHHGQQALQIAEMVGRRRVGDAGTGGGGPQR